MYHMITHLDERFWEVFYIKSTRISEKLYKFHVYTKLIFKPINNRPIEWFVQLRNRQFTRTMILYLRIFVGAPTQTIYYLYIHFACKNALLCGDSISFRFNFISKQGET